MSKGFPDNIRILMSDAFSGYCSVNGCLNPVHSYHHRLPETKYYIEKYPLFIHSPFNCAPVCEQHHIHHREYSTLNITEREASVYEEWLRSLINSNIKGE
jgi:hypothetical protein